MNLNQINNKIQQAKGRRELLTKQYNTISNEVNYLFNYLISIEKAQVLLQTVAENTQNQLRIHIEDIVNLGLDTCFPESYVFKLEFIQKRGRTECDIYLKDYEGNRVDPLQDNGGGLSDIVSFSLRLACWTISNTDPVIILDEPFKFLSRDLRPLAGSLLKELSQKLKLQIIMVSHDSEMIEIADKVFEI